MQEARQVKKTETDTQFYEKFFSHMTSEQLETEIKYQYAHGRPEVIELALREAHRRESQ